MVQRRSCAALRELAAINPPLPTDPILRGYEVAAGMFGGQECLSKASSGAVLTFASRMAVGAGETWGTVTTILATTSMVVAFAVKGYNIESAAPTAVSNSTRNSVTDSSTSSTSSSSTGESPPTITTTRNSSTNDVMSATVKAGIGVGASLAVLGLSALIATIFLFRRRRNNQLGKSFDDKSSNITDHGPEVYVSPLELHSDNLPSEMIDNGRRSPEMLHSNSIPSEMPDDGRRSPVELDAQRLSR